MNYSDISSWPHIPVDEIDREEISTVYSFGHYDGVGTGLVLWKEEYWYAKRFDLRDYRYWIIKLTPEQQKYALWYGAEWARLFHSGMSWNPDGTHMLDKDGIYAIREGNSISNKQPEYSKFHADNKRPEPDDIAEVSGYFEGWRK